MQHFLFQSCFKIHLPGIEVVVFVVDSVLNIAGSSVDDRVDEDATSVFVSG